MFDQRNLRQMIEYAGRAEVVGMRFYTTRSVGPMDLPVEVVKPYYAAHRDLYGC